jgi:proline-specific peptidase
MANVPVKEGEIEFPVPGLSSPAKTWYKIVGDLAQDTRKTPLVLLHGGPGAAHDYLLPFTDLASQYSIPVIFYDQLGCGNSTHLRERNGDKEFWTEELFRNELDNLIDHLGIRSDFDILGHSWGGMLGSAYASYRPSGLRRLIIACSPASMELWGQSSSLLLDKMPPHLAKTIRDAEATGDYENELFESAITEFYKRHVCRAEPYPVPELKVVLDTLKDDYTVYGTM